MKGIGRLAAMSSRIDQGLADLQLLDDCP